MRRFNKAVYKLTEALLSYILGMFFVRFGKKSNGFGLLKGVLIVGFAGIFCASSPLSKTQVLNQPDDLLAEPEIVKIETAERADFERRFAGVQWTGAGFRAGTVIDRIPTRELRARFQARYGDPTQKLKHLFEKDQFRPGHYIQFEYWLVINDEIPMMVLDIDGPFGNGLVFAGDNRYVDLMPEIKRTLTRELMGVSELGEYEDHYYELNERQWYIVRYSDGAFYNEKVEKPDVLK